MGRCCTSWRCKSGLFRAKTCQQALHGNRPAALGASMPMTMDRPPLNIVTEVGPEPLFHMHNGWWSLVLDNETWESRAGLAALRCNTDLGPTAWSHTKSNRPSAIRRWSGHGLRNRLGCRLGRRLSASVTRRLGPGAPPSPPGAGGSWQRPPTRSQAECGRESLAGLRVGPRPRPLADKLQVELDSE